MKTIFRAVLALGALSATCMSASAATLDDVMARLESLQRDNQAMRKEISALRQKEQRSAVPQAVETRNAPSHAPSHQLSPAASSAMAAVPARGRYAEPPQAFSWSGFYLGVHAGYGWGSNDWGQSPIIETDGASFGTPLSPKTNGVLGGIQAGANLQMQNWVLGIAADLAFMHADDKRDGAVVTIFGLPVAGATTSGRTQIDWLATFTGRWGYAFDRSLFYVKGGVAAAAYINTLGLTTTVPGTNYTEVTKDGTRVGWTVGAGWEYAFASNWSAMIEYNYLDLGTTSEILSLTKLPTSFQQEIEHTLHIVKAGVNYRF